MANPIIAKIIEIIQKRITTVDSAHPFFQNGDELEHLEDPFPVSLKEIT